MNKKYLLLVPALALSTFGFAQKAKVNQALREIENGNTALQEYRTTKDSKKEAESLLAFQKAFAALNEAVENESTKGDAKTWYVKAKAHFFASDLEQLNNKENFDNGNIALVKALELNPKLVNETDFVNVAIQAAYQNFNAGIGSFNNEDYMTSMNEFGNVMRYVGDKPSKKFSEVYPAVDTIRASAILYQGQSASNMEDYVLAETLLSQLLGNKIIDQKDVIYQLIHVSEKTKNVANVTKYIDMGRTQFPTDENMVNLEMNYYIETKQYPIIVEKLEASKKQNPNNATTALNLGIVYSNMAAPNEEGVVPENAVDLEKKAEENYLLAASLAGDNPDINQSLGIHYYNAGVDANNKSREYNKSKDTKVQARAAQMISVRNIYYNKAQVALDKAVALYEANGLNDNNKPNYATSLEALYRIYATKNDAKKATEIRSKIDNL